jgi:hypothetical protein
LTAQAISAKWFKKYGQCQKVAEKEDEQKAPPARSGQNPVGETAQIG